jgi:hypothetical protein
MVTNKNQNNNLLKLSIQVRLNGLSFCILNSITKDVVWYKKTEFQKDFNPIKILKQLELHFNEENKLQEFSGDVVLIFSNDLYSLVPEEYFIEEEASNYLKFNTKILKTDVVAFDHLQDQKIVNVYIPFTNITNYLFDKFGEFEYKHGISVLCQAVLQKPSHEGVHAYLNVYANYYDLVIVKDNKLLLSNTFQFDTKEDFIYYLLFTAEQLEMDPSEFNLLLLGDIDKEADIYKIAYTYVKNIEFVEPNLDIDPAEYNSANFKREAFILLKSLECV